ncbi:MAG: cysteine desulfurase NifS [Actinomycetota bacterium]
MNIVYMDHAATTPTDPEVVKAMLPYFTEKFGNPSTLYSVGREAKRAVEEARAKVAGLIGAEAEEIVFTSGGTEADNFALEGVAFANESKGHHIITSTIEHHAVLEPSHFLEKRGFKVTYLPVDSTGLVDPEDVRKAITDKTILISIMHANNEIGTIEPIEEIGKIAREAGIYFHTDAVQTVGSLPIDVDKLNGDLLSISAHKLYGPKGVGALYIRKGTKMVSFLQGGGQERKRRASTENVPGIVGFGKAVEIDQADMEERSVRLSKLRDGLIKGILGKVDRSKLNGHPTRRLPNNVSVCMESIEGESLLLALDSYGICASSGSACTSGSLEPSHVLTSLGLTPDVAFGSLRLTVGRHTTEDEVKFVLEVLPQIVAKLRVISPV